MEQVVYHRGEHDRVWLGFTRSRAIEWSRVLRVHWPNWPGAEAMWQLTTALGEGVPAALTEWADRARTAEALGFSPAAYDRLQLALDAIPAIEHVAHPDNEPDPRWPGHTIRAFEPELWSDWPLLVALGWDDQEAVLLLLSAREALGVER